MLSRFSLEHHQIHDAIVDLDERLLDSDDLQVLIQYCPTQDEIELLKPIAGAVPDNLGAPERFFLAIQDIPDLKTRLECWKYKITFSLKFVELKALVEVLLRAGVEVKKNTKFIKVLEVILAFGNFMNANTNRGGVWGFRLETLLKIVDIKSSSSPDKNLLHFVIEFLQNNYPDTINFYETLKSVEKAADLSQLSIIKEDLKALNDGLAMIEKFNTEDASQVGKFKDVMNKFVPTSKQLLEKLKGLFDKGESLYKELITMFGEPDTTTLNEFFGTIDKFCITFEKTKVNLEQQIASEQKKKEAAEKRALIQQLKEKQTTSKPSGPNNKTSKLDMVFAAIQSGQAYV
eukprot:TRINITY_DN6145_c0_g4_i2.p1 TRINITY_DN6145_c0_g4~~TRINITY_DN6145_c0_g4_i2.p1  ORF type:complete len:346 (-),score=84.97 TRINITY_DN6145_c0_g4_i2:93-1130(-)